MKLIVIIVTQNYYGRERCVNSTCLCLQPYFKWTNKDGEKSHFPCYHELCGGDELNPTTFSAYTNQLTSRNSNEIVELKDKHYCQYGSCIPTVDDMQSTEYFCKCENNIYFGPSCEYTQDFCSREPCLNGGTCFGKYSNSSSDYEFTCTCSFPYVGALCHALQDECQSQPCLNGAACVNSNRGSGDQYFTCLCPPGFDGDRCEHRYRRTNQDQTQIAVIAATVFLVTCILMCCAIASSFRLRERQMYGNEIVKITEVQPVLLERLYKIKDAINQLENEGGLKSLHEQMEALQIVPPAVAEQTSRINTVYTGKFHKLPLRTRSPWLASPSAAANSSFFNRPSSALRPAGHFSGAVENGSNIINNRKRRHDLKMATAQRLRQKRLNAKESSKLRRFI